MWLDWLHNKNIFKALFLFAYLKHVKTTTLNLPNPIFAHDKLHVQLVKYKPRYMLSHLNLYKWKSWFNILHVILVIVNSWNYAESGRV